MIERLDDYQAEALKTVKPGMSQDHADFLKYLCMKLAEETGEVIEPIVKHLYHGKPLNKEDVAKELGDLSWYLSNIASAFGFSLSQIATWNIEKLRARHGETYRPEFYNPGENNSV